jgi:hypothetical protein
MASTIAYYIIDVSPGMAEEVYDQETERTVSKLDLCKEYVCRKISPKVCAVFTLGGTHVDWRNGCSSPQIQSGRKTEHAGVMTFGGRKAFHTSLSISYSCGLDSNGQSVLRQIRKRQT